MLHNLELLELRSQLRRSTQEFLRTNHRDLKLANAIYVSLDFWVYRGQFF